MALSADVLAVGDDTSIYVYTSCDPGEFWNDLTAACESCGLGKTAGRGASGRLIKTQGRTDASRPPRRAETRRSPYKNAARRFDRQSFGRYVVIWVTN